MIIGYQGDIGSNNEYAAKYLYPNEEHIPLICSKNVKNALLEDKIDLGIMALENSIAGVVLETKQALADGKLELINKITLPIHHCLFGIKRIPFKNIKSIVSHEMALKQTSTYLKNNIPNAILVPVDDQALAAKKLFLGEYKDNTCVICRKEAGEINNLILLDENIEDNKTNRTTFGVFVKRKKT